MEKLVQCIVYICTLHKQIKVQTIVLLLLLYMAYLNNCLTECQKIQHMIDLTDTSSVCNITSHNFINICNVKFTELCESSGCYNGADEDPSHLGLDTVYRGTYIATISKHVPFYMESCYFLTVWYLTIRTVTYLTRLVPLSSLSYLQLQQGNSETKVCFRNHLN